MGFGSIVKSAVDLSPTGLGTKALTGQSLSGLASDAFGAVTGRDAADAAIRAAEIQAEAVEKGIGEVRAGREQAFGMLSPFQEAGTAQLPGITSLVSDPQAQLSFIQDNPFFQSLSSQATRELAAKQAAGGKLGTGGTAASLQERLLGLGTGLVNQNIQQRMGLANLGMGAAGQAAQTAVGTSGSIADLIGSAGAAQAAGQIGAAQAKQQGLQNILGIGALALSDVRHKKDIQKITEMYGLPVYRFKYIDDDEEQVGFMAHEVKELFPDAVKEVDGKMYVDYGRIYAH